MILWRGAGDELKNISAKWLNRGFCLILLVPMASYAITFIFNVESIIQVGDGERSRITEFPASAKVFIISAVSSLMLSVFFSIKFAVSLPLEKLRKFEESVMSNKSEVGGRPRFKWEPFIFVATIIGCLAILTHGPVDLAVLSGSGLWISKSPPMFAFTQMLLVLLAYGCIVCLSLWITVLIKLRKGKA